MLSNKYGLAHKLCIVGVSSLYDFIMGLWNKCSSSWTQFVSVSSCYNCIRD